MKIAGKVTVCGVQGTVAYAGVLVNENKLTEWDFGDSANGGETLDGVGNFLTVYSSGDSAKLNIAIIPFDPASPGALATAKTKVALPAKLAKVTIAGTGIPAVDGDWHYSRTGGGSIKPDSTGQALKVNLPLERFDNDGTGPKYLGDAVTIS